MFYVASSNMPSVLHLLPIVSGDTGTGGSSFDRGQAVYLANCQLCHGANLQGQPMSGIPSLIGVTNRMSHVEFEEVVTQGRATMPAFPQLQGGALEMLQLYLANPELALTPGETITSEEVPNELPERYQSGWVHVLDSLGVPVIKPPWFRLTAYDLNDGTIKWQVPVGEVPHLTEQGIQGTGAALRSRGGPAITAGGLIFLPTGEQIQAYDSDTGEVLWSAPIPGSGDGIPTVYAVDGRQFVVVPASRRRRPGAPVGEAPDPGPQPRYVAFALPEN
jgi:quinoprotein glucose dehydrogenase